MSAFFAAVAAWFESFAVNEFEFATVEVDVWFETSPA